VVTVGVGDECSVLGCSLPAQHIWSTGETEQEQSDWMLCPTHFRRMRLGMDWGTHTDLARPADRWILMGPDLGDRDAEAMQQLDVCIEFGPYGRDVRLAISTLQQSFGVVLDENQARELGTLLTGLSGPILPHDPS
jgi:hypothetical protein